MKRTSDPIHLIQAANPVPESGLVPDGSETLMEEIVGMTGEDRQPRKRIRRSLVLSTAAVAVVLAGAAAWVIAMPEETTNIACNGEVIIDARSGDPVADCAAEMRRQGIEPVNLSAYVNNGGAVGVFEEGADIPSSWRLLEDGFAQDTAIIRLQEALDDIATGIESGCYSDDEAIVIVERELAASGLDWEIATRSNEDLSSPTCAGAIVLPEDRQVLVVQSEARTVAGGQVQEWQSQKQAIDTLAARLILALNNECMTLNDAAETAIGITFDVGAEYMTQIDTIDEPDAACTTATINVGGSVFLVLRGPADGPVEPIVLPKPAPESSAVAATPYSVAREEWGDFIQELLGGVGFDNQGVLVSWGEDGSANAMAMNGAGRELIIGYEPWRSGEASTDSAELQQVLGMPGPGTGVDEGVLFIMETTFAITVKLAVPEGVISATIPVGTTTSRSGDLNAELLSALVRTASPIARELLGADPGQLEFVNYLPHPDE